MIIKKAESIKGHVSIPGDRSITLRSIMLASIAQGTTILYNYSNCYDSVSTISVFRSMGIMIWEHESDNGPEEAPCLYIQGKGMGGLQKPLHPLNTDSCKSTLHTLPGILSAQTFTCSLTGDESIIRYPMDRIIKPLHLMGSRISGNDSKEYPPITITGRPLRGIQHVNTLASADVKSALLMAGLYASGKTVVYEPRQSANHTEILLEQFGARITTSHTDGPGGRGFCDGSTIEPCMKLHPRDIRIPGDFTSAAYFVSLAALVPDSEIFLSHIGVNVTRSLFLSIVSQMGVSIQMENSYFTNGEKAADLIISNGKLRALTIPANVISSIVDELPALAVLATGAPGTTVIQGLSELKNSEDIMLRDLYEGLHAMGAHVICDADTLRIEGGHPLHSAVIESTDHRVIMAMSIAALVADPDPDGENGLDEGTVIKNADHVGASFPGFFKELHKLIYENS